MHVLGRAHGALQAIAKTYSPDNMDNKTLQEFIIYFGILQLLLSQLPDIHALRFVNLIATVCTVGFAIIATALSLHDGTIFIMPSVTVFSLRLPFTAVGIKPLSGKADAN